MNVCVSSFSSSLNKLNLDDSRASYNPLPKSLERVKGMSVRPSGELDIRLEEGAQNKVNESMRRNAPAVDSK